MNSPFPGMDPYLEDPAFWGDFHHTFITFWREAVANALPVSYEARVEETVQLVQLPDELSKVRYPDVAISRRKDSQRFSKDNGGIAVLEPRIIPHRHVEERRHARIQILHRPGRSLVAILELLSPTNKVGNGFGEYCAKRPAILQRKTHLVELDLLLGGRRLPLAKPLPRGDYHLLISRGNRSPNCEVYSWPLRQSLPTIPIPLKAPDADVIVDLQAVFRETYQRGRYAPSLRYGKAPHAPVGEKDRRWAMQKRPGLNSE